MTVEWIKQMSDEVERSLSFQEHEEICRTIFESVCDIPNESTEYTYAYWDKSATGKSHTFNIEIKYRHIDEEKKRKYDKEGYWLEYTKYEALMKAYNETGSLPIYVTFIKGGTGYEWNLLNIEPEWSEVYATTTTANGTYNKERRKKRACFPLPNQGREIKW